MVEAFTYHNTVYRFNNNNTVDEIYYIVLYIDLYFVKLLTALSTYSIYNRNRNK